MNGTKSRFVSRYSKENPMAISHSNGPAVMASSKKDFGTDRYQTRSVQWCQWCMPSKYLL